MGYNTHYKLVLPDNLDDELLEKINRYIQDDDGFLNMAIPNGEPCTWYEHENDMLMLSKIFPDVLFELNGTGEES
jgi:hypothetical protein